MRLTPESPDPPRDAATSLNDSQRRSLSVGLHHVAELLDEVEHVLGRAASRSPFHRLRSDLSPARAGLVRDLVERVRAALLAAAERHGLEVAGPALDAGRALETTLLAAVIGVEEMRPGRLRGYGALSDETAHELARTCDHLERALRDVLQSVARGGGEEFGERLARLGRTAIDSRLLATLERVIGEHGLVELRPLLRSLLERLEERSFHVAVFGRVSSGKSSLLNALLGVDLLPVGVTPVTAVPTRVRVGDPPALRVELATGATESMGIESLAELASEESNPGNRRRVTRLEVVFPVTELPEGVVLVDTPGIGSLASAGASEAIAYLPRADLALLLIDVGSWIGRDELELLRLFRETAIPVEVLLSKADLVQADELERLMERVGATIEREADFRPPVTPVSSIAAGHPLVHAWAGERLRPRFVRRRELADESARRLAGRLLEQATVALGSRAGRRETTDAERRAVVERMRAADTAIAAARRAIGMRADRSRSESDAVHFAAAAAALAAWRSGASRRIDPTPLLGEAIEETAERERLGAVSILTALHAELLEAARKVDPEAAELFATRAPRPDLGGLPVLDGSAGLPPGRPLGRPLLATWWPDWATRRVARRLRELSGPAPQKLLREHSHRLREFGERATARLADAFHAATGPFVALADGAPGASRDDPGSRRRIEEDLAELEALRGAAASEPR